MWSVFICLGVKNGTIAIFLDQGELALTYPWCIISTIVFSSCFYEFSQRPPVHNEDSNHERFTEGWHKMVHEGRLAIAFYFAWNFWAVQFNIDGGRYGFAVFTKGEEAVCYKRTGAKTETGIRY